MARKRQKNHHHHTFNISGKPPKFFKIILQDTIQDGQLAIPRKFVKEHGDCFSSRISIKVSDGTIWKMELLKGENYEAWLQKGWKEFEQHYSLQHGFLLLFKYEDKSNFHVIIFDTTLLEIEYPIRPNSSPILDKDPSFIPNLDQNPSSSPNLNGFMKIGDSDGGNLEFEGVSGKPKGRRISRASEVAAGVSGESKGRRISQALEVADKFSSINPWFKVVLKASKGRLFSLSPPIGFIREHIDCNLDTVILKIEGCNCCWPIKLNVYEKKSSARLSAGWSAFLKDNHLKDKDVCVFELVAQNELKVHIFRHLPLGSLMDVAQTKS